LKPNNPQITMPTPNTINSIAAAFMRMSFLHPRANPESIWGSRRHLWIQHLGG
jgi:hypothetical protein